jgi:hypothetical protein
MSTTHSNLGRGLGNLISEVSKVKAVPAPTPTAAPAPGLPPPSAPADRPDGRGRYLVPALVCALVAVSLVAAWLGWRLRAATHPGWRPKGDIEVSAAEPLTPMVIEQGGVAPLSSATASLFAHECAGNGMRVEQRAGSARIVLEQPLFRSAVVFEPAGLQLLREFGRRLAAATNAVTLHVVGHTNNDPVRPGGAYRTSDDLSFARAVAVVHLLREQGVALPMTAGVGPAPFPNTDPASKARNRTVTIEIRPASRPES